jgi:hypothetical protein
MATLCDAARWCGAGAQGNATSIYFMSPLIDAAVGNDRGGHSRIVPELCQFHGRRARSGRDLSRELAVDFRHVYLGLALERSRLRNLHLLAVPVPRHAPR